MVRSAAPANTEFIRRASTVVSEDLVGDPNDIQDVRITRAIPGDWFIPFDKPNTRWQKIQVIGNLWVEFKPFDEPTFTVKATSGDNNPDVLEEKIAGTAGTQINFADESVVRIDTRRTALFYGG